MQIDVNGTRLWFDVDALRPGIGRLEVLEGAGHFPWKDAPERYFAVIAEFVAGAGALAEARAST